MIRTASVSCLKYHKFLRACKAVRLQYGHYKEIYVYRYWRSFRLIFDFYDFVAVATARVRTNTPCLNWVHRLNKKKEKKANQTKTRDDARPAARHSEKRNGLLSI